jgi:exodeoxyribonuclease-3
MTSPSSSSSSSSDITIINWNVNGIRSNAKKQKNGEVCTSTASCALATLIKEQNPDFICLQEVRSQAQADLDNFRNVPASGGPLRFLYNNPATRKGYSGTAILTRHEAMHIYKNFEGWPSLNDYNVPADMLTEGRVLTAEYPTYYVVTTYTPNSKSDLARLQDRQAWDVAWRAYLQWLESTGKNVITCGDLNVAHTDMDIHSPKGRTHAAGFTMEERTGFSRLVQDAGFVDTFRHCHPATKKWSWWSNFANSRARGVGWRIDYILTSASLRDHILHADCLNEYHGSDHCPVIATLTL